MSRGKDRTIARRPDGTWQNKLDGASKASSVHSTQGSAISRATQMMKRPGQGGELKVKGVDGKIRSKDTINRPDPLPPKDREH